MKISSAQSQRTSVWSPTSSATSTPIMRNAKVIANPQSARTVVFIRVPIMSDQNRYQVIDRKFPEHMYVDIGTVAKKSSLLVLLLSVFSLGISFITQFDLINPLFAILSMVAAIGFFAIGRMLSHS